MQWRVNQLADNASFDRQAMAYSRAVSDIAICAYTLRLSPRLTRSKSDSRAGFAIVPIGVDVAEWHQQGLLATLLRCKKPGQLSCYAARTSLLRMPSQSFLTIILDHRRHASLNIL